MFLIASILNGPLKIALLVLAILFVHQLITQQPLKTYSLEFIVKRMVVYSAGILVLIILLIQLNMYDTFSIVTLFFGLLVYTYLGLETKNSVLLSRNKRQQFLLSFFGFMERNLSMKKLFWSKLGHFKVRKPNYTLIMALVAGVAVLLSRYFFLKNDLYTLSSLWVKNLETVKGINANILFEEHMGIMGELVMINFYSKVTGISEEVALHSFGLLECFGLACVMYWMLSYLTKSKFVAPVLGMLFYAFAYKWLPININLLIEHRSLFLGFFFAFPAMVYCVYPYKLAMSKKRYVVVMMLLFMATGFTNFFVAFIVLPLFMLVALLFSNTKTRPYVFKALWAYGIAVSITLVFHLFMNYINNGSILGFLRSSILAVESYLYFPQLAKPKEVLVQYYLYLGLIVLLFLLPLCLRQRTKWVPTLVFVVFINSYMTLDYFQFTWMDRDLYYQSLVLLVVLLIGIAVGIVAYYIKLFVFKNLKGRVLGLTALVIGVTVSFYYTNGFYSEGLKSSNLLNTKLLSVYNELSANYLPYSYAVVNQKYGYDVSKNEHHFMSYQDFIENYQSRDSIFWEHRNDKEFLSENPQVILPESIFVFITKANSLQSNFDVGTPEHIVPKLMEQLTLLKKKKREVELFYDNEFLSIYKITNTQKASNLNDLILSL